ncbi:MAG: MATE family efflux transporter [Clostridia bacterium]
MQTIQRVCRPYIGTRSFYADALKVMIPVTIQQLINNLFNMVDSLMVGSLDINGLAMSAVSVANKPYVIFFGVFFGMTGAAGLMISQYYGANDRKTCQGLFALQMVIGLAISLFFCALLGFMPEQVMRIFVTDARTIDLGVRYMRVICLSYVPVAISNTCIFSMRALGQNRTSVLVSLATMGVNAACNYVLIFGKLGFPAMGVEGAAWGTLIARLFEMVFYIVLLSRKRMVFTLHLLAFLKLPKAVVKSFLIKAVPLITNEILWTFGMNIYFWCYAHLNEAALPAITIAEQCSQIAAVMAMGTASAVSVLIGTELGANRLREAKNNCKKLLTLVVCIGLLCMMVCCLLGVIMPYAFQISDELRTLTTRVTVIMGVLSPLNFIYAFCFFCMRAGGDTRNAMLLDSGYMWLLPVPAAIVMAVFFQGRITVVFATFVIQLLMNSKVVLALYVLKKGRWVRNLTQE